MEFTKEVVFLGIKAEEITRRETGEVIRYYSAQFFDPQTQSPLTITMGENSPAVGDCIECGQFEKISARFKLVAKDKLYKLSLVSLDI